MLIRTPVRRVLGTMVFRIYCCYDPSILPATLLPLFFSSDLGLSRTWRTSLLPVARLASDDPLFVISLPAVQFPNILPVAGMSGRRASEIEQAQFINYITISNGTTLLHSPAAQTISLSPLLHRRPYVPSPAPLSTQTRSERIGNLLLSHVRWGNSLQKGSTVRHSLTDLFPSN